MEIFTCKRVSFRHHDRIFILVGLRHRVYQTNYVLNSLFLPLPNLDSKNQDWVIFFLNFLRKVLDQRVKCRHNDQRVKSRHNVTYTTEKVCQSINIILRYLTTRKFRDFLFKRYHTSYLEVWLKTSKIVIFTVYISYYL